jgi:hypothetical protein
VAKCAVLCLRPFPEPPSCLTKGSAETIMDLMLILGRAGRRWMSHALGRSACRVQRASGRRHTRRIHTHRHPHGAVPPRAISGLTLSGRLPHRRTVHEEPRVGQRTRVSERTCAMG